MKKYFFLPGFLGLIFRGLWCHAAIKIPDKMYFEYDRPVSIRSMPGVSLRQKEAEVYTANLLGVIPVKEVSVSHSRTRYVQVSGRPFGIKMFCDGVMVVGFSDILTSSGYKNPRKAAGLKAGDIITAIDGKAVQTNEEVARLISQSRGRVTVSYEREGRQMECTLTPRAENSGGEMKTGMWVRDSCAGVGTMTFYEPKTGIFAGLGHGIKDADTALEIPLLSGETVPVKITGLSKSKNGTAGRLKGSFTTTLPSGKILINGDSGVYGKYYGRREGQLMPVATPGSIHTGRRQILTTINGEEPGRYDVEIEKIMLNGTNPVKNMVIRVTDPRLLALAGGIVRGMSGSPIIQDGALVGAVTHVFVNQVDRGYGIFAWNMLETSDEAA